MKKRFISILFAGLLVFTCLSNASASPFEIDSTGNLPTYISSTYSSTFDISSIGSEYIHADGSYRISSARVYFSFSDDFDSWKASESYTKDTKVYVNLSAKGDYTYKYERDHFYNYTKEDESSHIAINDQTSIDGSNDNDSPSIEFVDVTDTGWIQTSSNSKTIYRTFSWEKRVDHTGDWSASFYLSSINLSDLMDDGMLSYDVSSWLGDFNLNRASIYFDAEQAPVPTPEPSTVLLLGVGLAGLLAYRRKEKN